MSNDTQPSATESRSQHTPCKWRAVPTTTLGAGTARMDIVSDGAVFSPSFVAGDILPEDAEYIVRAVNAHEELIDSLQRLLRAYESDYERMPMQSVKTSWETNSQDIAQACSIFSRS